MYCTGGSRLRLIPTETPSEYASGSGERRLRILLVTTVTPDPNGRGIDRRAAQQLEALARLGSVDVVIPDTEPRRHTLRAANPTVAIHEVMLRPSVTIGALRLRRVRAMRSRLAQRVAALWLLPTVEQRACADYARSYCRQFNRTGYDLIFAFRLPSATWIDSLGMVLPGTPRVVDFDDIESLAYARRLAVVPPATYLWRWREAAFCAQIRRLERRILARWTGVLVCSEVDRDRLARRAHAVVRVVPNAIPVPPPIPMSAHDGFNVLFVGTLDYEPNALGLTWFLEHIWPHVRRDATLPSRLDIVGPNPPENVQAFDGWHGIRVHGRVEALEPYYERADVAVAPILTGGGTRIKILEAFALHRPVVSTTIGCEGIPARNGEHLLIEDAPGAFASALLELGRRPELRARLAAAAYMLARERFERTTVQADLTGWLASLLTHAGPHADQRIARNRPAESF